VVLEFFGMDEKSAYTESDLETAIISKLQSFLLELGKGFLFEARQKRFNYDLKHQDIGQMQVYVNYYDRNVKQNFEKPTIDILLCKEKNDSVVQMILTENANIYASEYNLYLPDKKLLQQKLQEWADEFEAGNV
jgi:hypothetical protein